ncbi:MAG: response regulator transcription factor [Oscillospiraceae bacterium]|nr:response regulator transcription factor [Oscillospiraceae bacterium]
MRILIVEDEVRLARTLAELLRRQGYTADMCHDGVSGLDSASSGIYDLVVLDAMLPGMDGFALLRSLRGGGSAVPVLMLTARADVTDRVQGLDSGADYYLTKPFEPQELLACIRLLLRRSGGEVRLDDAVSFGDLRLESGTFLLSCAQRSVRLSRREYDLMELLIRNRTQIVTKEQLLLKVWGYDSEAEDNNVEVYISFLRRKLTHLHSAVRIKTIRMVGYCLEEVEA